MKSLIAKFLNLRNLCILDGSDDSPTETNALCAIVTDWADVCPSVRRVMFNADRAWERECDVAGTGSQEMFGGWVEIDVE